MQCMYACNYVGKERKLPFEIPQVSGRSKDTYMRIGNTTQQGRSVKASESLLKRMQTRYWIQGVS